MSTVKEEVQRLVETLPDDATWDTVMYEIYVRQKIAMGHHTTCECKRPSFGSEAKSWASMRNKRTLGLVNFAGRADIGPSG